MYPRSEKDTQRTCSSSKTAHHVGESGAWLRPERRKRRTSSRARPAHAVGLAASDWLEEPAAEKRDRGRRWQVEDIVFSGASRGGARRRPGESGAP